MTRLLSLPILYYSLIIIYLILYTIFRWKKQPGKKNFLTIVSVGILLISTTVQADRMNLGYVLKAFEADSMVIQMGERSISTDVKKIFAEYNFLYSNKESLLYRLQNIGENPYLRLLFYEDDNKIIEMRVYVVEEGTGYSVLVNGVPVVIRCRGYRHKFSKAFYQHIEEKTFSIELK
jgi:hypothetical protein